MDVTWASAVFFITELKPMTGWKQVSKSAVCRVDYYGKEIYKFLLVEVGDE